MNSGHLRIAIIGNGIAGLACGANLDQDLFEITVFDKSRGFGGRSGTRREQNFQFDHGSQYIQSLDPSFSIVIDEWQRNGVIKPWKGNIGELVGSRIRHSLDERPVYVGTPKMSSISHYLSNQLTDAKFHLNTKIVTILKKFEKWHIFDDQDRVYGPFDYLVLTIPPPQASSLLTDFPYLVDILSTVKISPRWALMIGLKHRLNIDYDGVFVNHPVVRWLSRNNSKPDRPKTESWVLHATREWSIENLERSQDWVRDQLFEAFKEVTGFDSLDAELLIPHRWRYAIVDKPLDQNFIIDRDRGLALAGDYLLDKSVEGAYLSGQILGRRLNKLVV